MNEYKIQIKTKFSINIHAEDLHGDLGLGSFRQIGYDAVHAVAAFNHVSFCAVLAS